MDDLVKQFRQLLLSDNVDFVALHQAMELLIAAGDVKIEGKSDLYKEAVEQLESFGIDLSEYKKEPLNDEVISQNAIAISHDFYTAIAQIEKEARQEQAVIDRFNEEKQEILRQTGGADAEFLQQRQEANQSYYLTEQEQKGRAYIHSWGLGLENHSIHNDAFLPNRDDMQSGRQPLNKLLDRINNLQGNIQALHAPDAKPEQKQALLEKIEELKITIAQDLSTLDQQIATQRSQQAAFEDRATRIQEFLKDSYYKDINEEINAIKATALGRDFNVNGDESMPGREMQQAVQLSDLSTEDQAAYSANRQQMMGMLLDMEGERLQGLPANTQGDQSPFFTNRAMDEYQGDGTAPPTAPGLSAERRAMVNGYISEKNRAENSRAQAIFNNQFMVNNPALQKDNVILQSDGRTYLIDDPLKVLALSDDMQRMGTSLKPMYDRYPEVQWLKQIETLTGTEVHFGDNTPLSIDAQSREQASDGFRSNSKKDYVVSIEQVANIHDGRAHNLKTSANDLEVKQRMLGQMLGDLGAMKNALEEEAEVGLNQAAVIASDMQEGVRLQTEVWSENIAADRTYQRIRQAGRSLSDQLDAERNATNPDPAEIQLLQDKLQDVRERAGKNSRRKAAGDAGREALGQTEGLRDRDKERIAVAEEKEGLLQRENEATPATQAVNQLKENNFIANNNPDNQNQTDLKTKYKNNKNKFYTDKHEEHVKSRPRAENKLTGSLKFGGSTSYLSTEGRRLEGYRPRSGVDETLVSDEALAPFENRLSLRTVGAEINYQSFPKIPGRDGQIKFDYKGGYTASFDSDGELARQDISAGFGASYAFIGDFNDDKGLSVGAIAGISFKNYPQNVAGALPTHPEFVEPVEKLDQETVMKLGVMFNTMTPVKNGDFGILRLEAGGTFNVSKMGNERSNDVKVHYSPPGIFDPIFGSSIGAPLVDALPGGGYSLQNPSNTTPWAPQLNEPQRINTTVLSITSPGFDPSQHAVDGSMGPATWENAKITDASGAYSFNGYEHNKHYSVSWGDGLSFYGRVSLTDFPLGSMNVGISAGAEVSMRPYTVSELESWKNISELLTIHAPHNGGDIGEAPHLLLNFEKVPEFGEGRRIRHIHEGTATETSFDFTLTLTPGAGKGNNGEKKQGKDKPFFR